MLFFFLHFCIWKVYLSLTSTFPRLSRPSASQPGSTRAGHPTSFTDPFLQPGSLAHSIHRIISSVLLTLHMTKTKLIKKIRIQLCEAFEFHCNNPIYIKENRPLILQFGSTEYKNMIHRSEITFLCNPGFPTQTP